MASVIGLERLLYSNATLHVVQNKLGHLIVKTAQGSVDLLRSIPYLSSRLELRQISFKACIRDCITIAHTNVNHKAAQLTLWDQLLVAAARLRMKEYPLQACARYLNA